MFGRRSESLGAKGTLAYGVGSSGEEGAVLTTLVILDVGPE